MRNLWNLIKKDLLLEFSFILNPAASLKDPKTRKRSLLYLLTLAIFGGYLIYFINYLLGLVDIFKAQGLGELFLLLGLVTYTSMIIFIGVSQVLSKLYFSDDISMLLPLPVSAADILGSKLISITVNSLLFALITVLPISLKYGGDWFFYLSAIFGAVAVTLLTISLIAMIEIVLMRFFNRLPNLKSLLQIVSMFMVIIFVLGFQWLMKLGQDMNISPESLPQLIEELSGKIYLLLPQVKLWMIALTESALWERLGALLLLLASALIIWQLVSRLGSRLFIKGLADNRVIAVRKHMLKRKTPGVRPVFLDIALKEIAEILKTPIYFFNIASIGVLIPILLMFPILINEGGDNFLSDINGLYGALEFSLGNNIGVGLLIGLLGSIFFGVTSQSAVSSITREGKRLWLVQTLPVKVKDQVNGRLVASYVFQTVGILPSALILWLLLRPPLEMVVAFFLGVGITAWMTSNLGLLIDILRPKLNWDNPQEAIKQNMNIFLFVMGSFGYLGLIIFSLVKLFENKLIEYSSLLGIGLVILVLHALLGVIGYILSRRLFKKRLNKFN